MKAIFVMKALWNTSEYKFTPGVEYDLSDCGDGYYSTLDDEGACTYFQNGRDYMFEEINEDSEKSKEKEMTYRMNGEQVSKERFNRSLDECESMKKRGVSVFIDFEVSFL